VIGMLQHLPHGLPLIVIAFVVVAILAAVARSLQGGGAFPYERTEKLFSAAERSFFGVLEQLFGDEYRVLGKVRLADIIRPRKGLSNSARTIALNRISAKHVDFAICDLQTLQVIGVVELDDSSHKRDSSRHGDSVKNKALAAAGVPIVRIAAQRSYSPAEIREKVSVLFGRAS
jgi:hypothetical protein